MTQDDASVLKHLKNVGMPKRASSFIRVCATVHVEASQKMHALLVAFRYGTRHSLEPVNVLYPSKLMEL